MRAVNNRLHNVPADISSFVGRKREIAEIARRLETRRLLTLTGSGGVGKSRLALHVAAAVQGRFKDGVWLVELAALTDPALVPRLVARALGLVEDHGRPPLQALVDFLRPRALLLVLDNCEHLLAACAELADRLLGECCELKILATSRQALGITGEITWLVPSLSTPAPGLSHQTDDLLERLRESEAVQLFSHRAASARVDFAVTEHNAPAVAQICRRLDGIPLALELAAARVKVLSVEQIAARLDRRFALLVGGSRTGLPRHQTLEAAFEWSYTLLSDAERALFRRLAVLAGSWTLEAAEAIVGDEVTDLLAHLVDKSLVLMQEPDGEVRYHFSESVRQFAEGKLEAAGEEELYRRRHFDWCLALAEQAEPHFWTAGQWQWCAHLERELDNLRAALAWCRLGVDRAELGVQLVGTLWHFWDMMGHMHEAKDLLEALLPITSERSPARAKALAEYGWLPFLLGEAAPREDALAESVQLSQDMGLPRLASLALVGKAAAWVARGDLVGATRLEQEAFAIARQAHDSVGMWVALEWQAETLRRLGDTERAMGLLEQALVVVRDLDDWSSGRVEASLARVAIARGDYQRAQALCQERLARHGGGDPRSMLFVLEALAWVASAQGQVKRAARLLSAAEAARERSGASLYFNDRDAHDRALAIARQPGGASFDTAWAEGRAMTPVEVVDYALASDQQLERGARAALPDGLTQREVEVLRLLAAGRSNREIADELVLSVRTVERHITNLYAKIGARGKADATAYAFRHRLT